MQNTGNPKISLIGKQNSKMVRMPHVRDSAPRPSSLPVCRRVAVDLPPFKSRPLLAPFSRETILGVSAASVLPGAPSTDNDRYRYVTGGNKIIIHTEDIFARDEDE